MSERLRGVIIGSALTLAVVAGAPAVIIAAQDNSTPQAEEIELQEVVVNGRRFTVDPYDLFECFIVKRTIGLPVSAESDALDMAISVQCFQRVGEEMVALEERETRDFGVSTSVAVGQAIISEPQVEAREVSPNG